MLTVKNELIEIKIAADEVEKEKIYQFRYRIYIEKMQKQLTGVDHHKKTLRDELDSWGILFYACNSSEVIGTIRVNLGCATDFPEKLQDVFNLNNFQELSPFQPILSYSSRLMIGEGYHGSTILFRLLAEAYKFAREQLIQYNFCYCAPELVGLYEQLGYRRYTENFVDQETGFRIPLVFVTEQIDYLHTVRSPFLRIAKKYHNSLSAEEFFLDRFHEVTAHFNSFLNDSNLWEIMTNRLQENPNRKIPLFKGFEQQEINQALKRMIVLNCQKGETILRYQDVGNEMFIILSGACEVSRIVDDKRYSIAILGPGDVFGEMGFVSNERRTADVSTLIPSEIIVLSSRFFETFMENNPKLAARILLNLSGILCRRLGVTTINWLESLQTK